MKKFRVLIVDDKIAVLNSIKDRIEYDFQFGDEKYKVELCCLDVEVIKKDEKFEFSNNTIYKLYDFCQKPFNLMLLDFGYVVKGIKTDKEVYKLQEKNPEKTIRELIDEIVLNPSHLIEQCYKEPEYYKKINKNFIEHSNLIYIYTYIPNTLQKHYTDSDVRKNVTKKHFVKAKNIKILDTREELFNNDQFDDKYDSDYYPFLIAKFLSRIIKCEIANTIIDQTNMIKAKYKQLKNNNNSKIFAAILLSVLTGALIPIIIETIKSEVYYFLVVLGIAFGLSISFVIIIMNNLNKQNDKLVK